MKGANYIPPDMLMPRVTKEIYKNLILDAIKANYNMLRIWFYFYFINYLLKRGGGQYEEDIFYDLCD